MIIRYLSKLLGWRKSTPTTPEPPPLEPSTVAQPRDTPVRVPTSGAILTWESELRAIAAEASAWSIETGGDLFGRWQANPTIFLATKAGPQAQRDNAHFRLDVDYLRRLSEPLASQWGLRYFGDWHSHHRLGLSAPSSGDQRRIRQLGKRNNFAAMAEVIVTTEGSRTEPTVRIHAWRYDLSLEGAPSPLAVTVLPGCSPVRHALIARRDFTEQAFREWEAVPLGRVRIGDDAAPPRLQPPAGIDTVTRQQTLAHLITALKDAGGGEIEQHAAAFGHILVVPLKGSQHLAFAIDGAWPMNVLEVHRLDREAGTTEVVDAPNGLSAPDVAGIVAVLRSAKPSGVRA
ncbi:MAG: hypothetical protein ABL957_03200 [Parvularculaceae bacterium]